MFDRFDVNNSGTMCVRELGACLQSLGIDTIHSEAEHALQALATYYLPAPPVPPLPTWLCYIHIPTYCCRYLLLTVY